MKPSSIRRSHFLLWVLSALLLASMPVHAAEDTLALFKERGSSDDALSVSEALDHGAAKDLIIAKIEPNKLSGGGRELKVKRNPVGEGCFVYNPRRQFNGVDRPLIWWVIDKQAYALNSPAKTVTPSLKWPREDGIKSLPTSEIIEYIFDGKPLTTPKAQPFKAMKLKGPEKSFTLRDYKIYRDVVHTFNLPEKEAMQVASEQYGVSLTEVKAAIGRVQESLRRYNARKERELIDLDWHFTAV